MDFSDSDLGVARARSRKISSMDTAVMVSSPGLYRCASPNLAHFLRSSISLVTFFVVVCTRTFFVVRTCRARGGEGMGSAPLNIERQGRGLGRGRENRRGERTGRRRGGHRRWLRFLGLDGARDGRSRTLEPSSFCLYSMIVFTPFASGPITYASRTRRGTRRVSRARAGRMLAFTRANRGRGGA